MLSDKELAILQQLTDVVRAYKQLPELRNSKQSARCFDDLIMQAQSIVMARPVTKKYMPQPISCLNDNDEET